MPFPNLISTTRKLVSHSGSISAARNLLVQIPHKYTTYSNSLSLFPAMRSSAVSISAALNLFVQIPHKDTNYSHSNSPLPLPRHVLLRRPTELKKQVSWSLHLVNETDEHVAFKVKATSPKKYCMRPNNWHRAVPIYMRCQWRIRDY